MYDSEFISNIVSPYYLYEVMLDTKMVSGLLFKLNLTPQTVNYVIPHENIDILKVSKYIEALLSGKLAELPIILGVTNKNYSDTLETCLPNIHKNIVDDDNTLVINQAISEIKEFILIDGHHRYTAVKQMLESEQNIQLWCWVVPFYKLKVSSFVKVFNNSYDCINISKLIHAKYKISKTPPKCSKENSLEIILYLDEHYYQLLSNTEKNFLDELDNIKNKLQQNNLILTENREIMHHNDYSSIIKSINSGFLVLKHSLVTHEMVLQVVKNGAVLPIHSTCFKPKPDCISNIIEEKLSFQHEDFDNQEKSEIPPHIRAASLK
jgi:uncharacterized protein (DUF1015 family)